MSGDGHIQRSGIFTGPLVCCEAHELSCWHAVQHLLLQVVIHLGQHGVRVKFTRPHFIPWLHVTCLNPGLSATEKGCSSNEIMTAIALSIDLAQSLSFCNGRMFSVNAEMVSCENFVFFAGGSSGRWGNAAAFSASSCLYISESFVRRWPKWLCVSSSHKLCSAVIALCFHIILPFDWQVPPNFTCAILCHYE